MRLFCKKKIKNKLAKKILEAIKWKHFDSEIEFIIWWKKKFENLVHERKKKFSLFYLLMRGTVVIILNRVLV
jgi:hypothetical protein